ncbi:MAG: exo-alpha-sialidase [Bryobacteraceae bacterium]|nr:exo-alpha-sialidase [Bryobacteraceae bacterium]
MRKTAALLILLFSSLAAAGEPLAHVDVFASGADGYNTFRIPALVTAHDGTLIAFAEARKENASDPGGGDIDLVYKTSADGGATWSALRVLDDPGDKWAASNPAPVADRDSGRVLILYNRWEPGHGTAESRPGTANNQTWARWSADNGRSWSEPVDLTRAARDYDDWGAMFIGPGGAIQMRSGRLIVPAAMKPDTYEFWISLGGFDGRTLFMRAYALFSDDHGATWKRGSLVKAQTDENQLVELADSSILMDARQGAGKHRWIMISPDGGRTWSDPAPGQDATPICASIERYTLAAAGDDRDRIVWTGPAGPGRSRLVVRVSYDEGQTFARERLIYGGHAAYSDIAILRDKTIGVLWERGVTKGYQFITFTKFGLDFLENSR